MPDRADAMQTIERLVWVAVFSALIICGAYISFPLSFSPVPIVLQNLFVVLSALLLGSGWAALSVVVYLFLGIVGLPVFSGGGGGIAHLLGPTGGYLLGFLVAAAVSGAIANPRGLAWRRRSYHRAHSLVRDSIAAVAALVGIYGCGLPWLMYVARLPLSAALAAGVIPFLIGDVIKSVVAIVVARFIRARGFAPS